jgi:isopentenyldiphosphate isomerase
MEYLHTYTHTGDNETELVTTYRCVYAGRIDFDPNEIDEVRYWSLDEIREVMGKGILSGHFEDEFLRYLRIHTPRISGP